MPTSVSYCLVKATQEAVVKRSPRMQHKDIPREHGEDCPQMLWQRAASCSVYVVDCRPLAKVVRGHPPLEAPEMAPLFERVTKGFFRLIETGWIPGDGILDLVTWHKREYNKMADFIINYTMDSAADWTRPCHKGPRDQNSL